MLQAMEMRAETSRKGRLHRSGFFGKFVVSFVTLIMFVVAANGTLETWFSYRETTDQLVKRQTESAKATASHIEQLILEIQRQISWTTRASSTSTDQRLADYGLLLKQVPSIDRVIFLDGVGKEQVRVTRDQITLRSGIDYSNDPRFKETQRRSLWLSAVYFDGPDPFIAIAVAHSGQNAGTTVAEVSLRFISDLIDRNNIGPDVESYVVTHTGRLIAYSKPDLRMGADYSALPQVAAWLKFDNESESSGIDPTGNSVLVGSATISSLNWFVFFEQPLSQALQPVYNLIYRTAWLLALGIVLAVLAGSLLARHLVNPIRALQAGARRLEASDFGHPIDVRTGDEMEELADHFNRMADRLQASYGRLEQKVAERTSDLAQSISELKALEEIGRAVASLLDIEAVLGTIVSRAVQLSQADAGEIFSYDGARGVFVLAEASGLDRQLKDSLLAVPVRLGEGMLGLAASQRKPISFPDLSSAPGDPLKDLTLSAGFKSVLVVPLLSPGGIIGALVLQRRAAGHFPERMIGLMQTFADQSVLAMTNARLFLEVEQKGKGLAVASQHKSQFIANMNHELRTPLNAVLGYSELLYDGLYGTLPDKALTVLERIQSNGKHLLGLINDVLDISKMEAGHLELSLDEYSIENVIQSVVAATGSLVQAKGIELKPDIEGSLPLGRGDERRLTQVLLNLVSNAIKFTEKGSIAIEARSLKRQFHINVRDTGAGIAPEDTAKVFEEFQQVDNSSTRAKGGTGLGLSISRRLIELHGGTITLDSTVGVGSCFSIVIPIRVKDQNTVVSDALVLSG